MEQVRMQRHDGDDAMDQRRVRRSEVIINLRAHLGSN